MSIDSLKNRVRAVILESFELSEADAPAKLDVDSVEQWDSLGHLALIEAIEVAFKVKLDHAEVVTMLGEDKIVAILAAKM